MGKLACSCCTSTMWPASAGMLVETTSAPSALSATQRCARLMSFGAGQQA